jgi:hypothetical protein
MPGTPIAQVVGTMVYSVAVAIVHVQRRVAG